jgi:hypothetical protein
LNAAAKAPAREIQVGMIHFKGKVSIVGKISSRDIKVADLSAIGQFKEGSKPFRIKVSDYQ